MNRYRRSVQLARELVAGQSVAVVMCHWACRPYGVAWWGATDTSGGPFNEQATHLVDLCRYVAGEIDSVEAYAANGAGTSGSATSVAAALRFTSGALGTLCYTCDAPDKFIAFEAVTTAGSGLGLSIVAVATERAGGEVSLCNRDGRSGLVVTVRVPLVVETKSFG